MEFNIKELIARAHFDYVGPAFPLWWGKNKTKFVLPSLKGIGKELLSGAMYFQTLTLSHAGKDYTFPNEPLVSLSLSKTIVETATVGKERKGTVKEYICTEDYQITIKGICVNENAEEREIYPAEQVNTLNDLFAINESLEVKNNLFFELFGIGNVVLKTFDLDEMAGEQGLQKYTITAVSDQDFYAGLNNRELNNSSSNNNLLNVL